MKEWRREVSQGGLGGGVAWALMELRWRVKIWSLLRSACRREERESRSSACGEVEETRVWEWWWWLRMREPEVQLIVGLRRLSHGVPKIMSNPDKEVT